MLLPKKFNYEMRSASTMDRHGKHADLHGVKLDAPFFTFLCEEIDYPELAEAHALLNYALNLGQCLEDNTVKYESDLSATLLPEQMFKTIAMIYNVDPEVMKKFWPLVDMALVYLKLKPIRGAYHRQCTIPLKDYHAGESFGQGIMDELGRIN